MLYRRIVETHEGTQLTLLCTGVLWKPMGEPSLHCAVQAYCGTHEGTQLTLLYRRIVETPEGT